MFWLLIKIQIIFFSFFLVSASDTRLAWHFYKVKQDDEVYVIMNLLPENTKKTRPKKFCRLSMWKETAAPCSFVLAETTEILLLDTVAHSKRWHFSLLQHFWRNFNRSLKLDPTPLTYLYFPVMENSQNKQLLSTSSKNQNNQRPKQTETFWRKGKSKAEQNKTEMLICMMQST